MYTFCTRNAYIIYLIIQFSCLGTKTGVCAKKDVSVRGSQHWHPFYLISIN